jgi:hypothetical protein
MKIMLNLLITLFGVAFVTQAQANHPDSIYWVVETNIYRKDHSIVRLYSQRHELVKSITLSRYLDIRKRKDRKVVQQLADAYTGKTLVSKRNKPKQPV